MKKKKYLLILLFLILTAVCGACSKKADLSENGSKETEDKEENGTGSSKKGSSEEGTFEAINIQKPDKTNMVQSICFLNSGVLRIVTTDNNVINSTIWDSADEGKTWEKVSLAADLIGRKPNEGSTYVFLSPTGDMAILYENCGIDLTDLSVAEYNNAYESKQDALYWLDENRVAAEIPITVKDGYMYQYSDDGTLYTNNEKEIFMLDKKTGDITKTIPFQETENIYLDSYAVSEGMVSILVKDIDNQDELKFYQYNTETDEKNDRTSDIQKLQEDANNYSRRFILAGDDTGIYLAANGLYQYKEPKKGVTEIVPKIQANMLAGSGELTDIAVNKKKDGFVLNVHDTRGNINYLYYYTNSETEKQARLKDMKELNIYSMKDNMELRQAVELYQEKNPKIIVNYQIGYSGEDGIQISDAIRSLNTEMLAGKGPDILLLDELPYNKYIEMGAMEDITKLVEEIGKKEKLFMNIINSSNKGGNIYNIPTKFVVPAIIGDSETTKAGNTKELVKIIEQKSSGKVPVMGPYDFASAAIELFVTSAQDIFEEDGLVNKEGLKSYYEYLKKIADISISEISQEEKKKNYSLIDMLQVYPEITSGGGTQIYFEEAQMEFGSFNSREALEVVNTLGKLKGMEYNYLNNDNGNSFIPIAVMGINKMAENKENAKAFLEFYLSDELQKLFWHGFSVNKGSFINYVKGLENEETSVNYYKDHESDEALEVTKLTPEEVETFAVFMEKLDTPVNPDRIVLQSVMEQADKYLFDGADLDAVVNEVVKKVDIYMSE